MWWIIWTALVLGALALLAWLGWRVWMKAKALAAAAREASELAARIDEAALAEGIGGIDHRPGPLGEPETLEVAVATRERIAEEREFARRRRLDRAVTRWRDAKIIS
ncbi:hypothetical protein [Bogoriella caseilytica]|uniref:Uncharacterized protein n=1 Tax=Bogoriella caseilytica TaxID=56055 RepID=A0A3N2BGM1_9MICO|nr:hypothetical protein [Bogoriella caseilytica]ROR74401.1 hypothetical protein EDD31_2816 [Bogoriella caseilytica]